MLATLRVETMRGTPVAHLAGEVDASNAGDLGQQVAAAVPNTAMGLVLDLSDTGYLDSSGIQLMYELADRLRRRQQRLIIVVPPESFIADVLGAVNLAGLAELRGTILEGIDALQPKAD
jgi:anti-sigma B factor antagonist